MSMPQILTLPLLGAKLPVNIFMVVDLPAPLGPRKPSTWPLLKLKLTLLTASLPP